MWIHRNEIEAGNDKKYLLSQDRHETLNGEIDRIYTREYGPIGICGYLQDEYGKLFKNGRWPVLTDVQQPEGNNITLEQMDAHVSRAVGIIFVPIILVVGTRQEEEEEQEAVLCDDQNGGRGGRGAVVAVDQPKTAMAA